MTFANNYSGGVEKPNLRVTVKDQGMPRGRLILVAILFSVIGFAIPSFTTFVLKSPFFVSGRGNNDSVIVAAKPTEPSHVGAQQYLEAFAWLARGKLEDLEIHQSLKVSVTESNEVEITGTIFTVQNGRYQLFKKWFSSNKNFPALLDRVTRIEAFSDIPSVKSVWLGEVPVAYFNDGTSGQVGGEIGDGWEILEIGRTEINLQKDGTIIALQF
ncbi:MAG: hypothetical protein AAF478_01985 [Pseudomonadota bacterium]